ncbi:type II secretion system protein [Chlamydia sp. 17-3921]|uniref:type II secretion system protein n=1 Tax=Chlamydia sp. 17-3921 TaxID=2675798 RepID=UPI001F46ABAC|nr:type II secretion system protein [Chlamydia sp. 17-3921]
MAMSLVCLVLIPCIQFYSRNRKFFEENIQSLQLPSIIDNCFFSIEKQMQKQMLAGEFPSSGSGLLASTFLYTSSGKKISIPYHYEVDVRKGVRVENNIVKACLVDVAVEIFPDQKHAVLVQRCMCVTH